MDKREIKNWLRVEKIKSYLFFALLLTLLAVLVSQSFFDMQRNQKEYISLSNDALDERMSSLYNEIDNLPSGAGNDVLFLSNLTNIKDYVLTNIKDYVFNNSDEKAGLNQDLSQFLDQNIAYKRLTIIKTSDQSGLNTERQIDGSIIFYSMLDRPFIDESYFKKILSLKEDKIYISDLQKDIMSFDSDSLVLYYAAPIFDDQKKSAGVLILTVDPSYFLDDVRNFSRPGEQVFLINSSGDYLANHDINREYVNSPNKFNFRQDFPEVANQILSNSDKRIIETENYVFAFRYIQPALSKFNIYNFGSDVLNDDFYWILISVSDSRDVNTVLSIIQKQRFLFITVTTILILLIGLLSFYIHWGLVNKIKSPRA